jgi:hypothetical protein
MLPMFDKWYKITSKLTTLSPSSDAAESSASRHHPAGRFFWRRTNHSHTRVRDWRKKGMAGTGNN